MESCYIGTNNRPNATLEKLNQLRQENVLCDITLIVESRRIPAHRNILASCSDYFYKMFTTDLIESQQKEICMYAVNGQAMESVINFFYTAQLLLSPDNVEDILSAASLLHVEDLRVACCKLLRRQLNPTNCLGICDFAESHSCKKLAKVAYRYVCDSFHWVVEEDEFLLLPVSQLIKLISSDKIRVDSEECVYNAVMRWLKHDLLHRQTFLSQIIGLVRLPLLGILFLEHTVTSDPLIASSAESLQLVQEAKKQLLELQPCSDLTTESLFAVGYDNQCAILEGFDVWPTQWRKMASTLPYDRPRAAYYDGRVYLAGRLHEYQTRVNISMECFDPERNRWFRSVAPSICYGELVAHGTYLYSIGGVSLPDGVTEVASAMVERYSTSSKKWSTVAQMNNSRKGHACVPLGDFIYAIGGSYPPSIEKYDPAADKWSTVYSFDFSVDTWQAAALNDKICIIGKREGKIRHSSTHLFCPASNALVSVPDPKALFGKHSWNTMLLNVNKQLYAFTSISRVSDEEFRTYHYIEVFNETLKEWSKCGRMQFPFSRVSLRPCVTVIPSAKKYGCSDFYTNVAPLQPRKLHSLCRRKKPFVASYTKPWSYVHDSLTDCSDPEYDEKDSDVECKRLHITSSSTVMSYDEDIDEDDEEEDEEEEVGYDEYLFNTDHESDVWDNDWMEEDFVNMQMVVNDIW